MFDFHHGGGYAASFGAQNPLIVAGVYAFIAYGIYVFRQYAIIIAALVSVLIFNLAFVWNENAHQSIIIFMGPGFESLVAAFLLFRAIYDLAPRGVFERFLNSLFGFGMGFYALMNGYALLYNKAYRLVYFEQKSGHGIGDFDRIASNIGFLNFESVMMGWMSLTVLCMIIPFIIYLIKPDL